MTRRRSPPECNSRARAPEREMCMRQKTSENSTLVVVGVDGGAPCQLPVGEMVVYARLAHLTRVMRARGIRIHTHTHTHQPSSTLCVRRVWRAVNSRRQTSAEGVGMGWQRWLTTQHWGAYNTIWCPLYGARIVRCVCHREWMEARSQPADVVCSKQFLQK